MARPLTPENYAGMLIAVEDSKLMVQQEALDFLSLFAEPLAVVSVCGGSRRDRHSLLTRLSHQGCIDRGAEAVCSLRSSEEGRAGLRLWNTFQCSAEDGSSLRLVLLELQGALPEQAPPSSSSPSSSSPSSTSAKAPSSSPALNIELFSLAVLLSSCVVLTQQGPINGEVLSRLSRVSQLTKSIRVHAAASQEQDLGDSWEFPASLLVQHQEALGSFSPSLFWVLRNFHPRQAGMPLTPTQYLEKVLTSSSQGTGIDSSPVQCVRSLFPLRSCVAVAGEADSAPDSCQVYGSAACPYMEDMLHEFVEQVLASGQPKRVGEAVVTGPVLAQMAESYITAVTEGAVESIRDAQGSFWPEEPGASTSSTQVVALSHVHRESAERAEDNAESPDIVSGPSPEDAYVVSDAPDESSEGSYLEDQFTEIKTMVQRLAEQQHAKSRWFDVYQMMLLKGVLLCLGAIGFLLVLMVLVKPYTVVRLDGLLCRFSLEVGHPPPRRNIFGL